MILAVEAHYLLPSSIPTAAIFLGAVLACALWAGAHFIPRPSRYWVRLLLSAVRTAVGFGAALACAQAAQRLVLLTTAWPIWALALAAAFAVELVISFYRLERQSVSRRQGVVLVSLRAVILVLVLALLAQPVRSLQWSDHIPRAVAVIIDESASMKVRDAYAPWEKVRLAEALGVADVPRPYRLELAEAELAALRDRLGVEIEWLDQLGRSQPDARRRMLEEKRAALYETLSQAAQRAEQQLAQVSAQRAGALKLDPAATAAMDETRAILAIRVRDPLQEAASLIKPGAAEDAAPLLGRVLAALKKSQTALGEAGPRVQALGRALDGAVYAALPAAQKTQVDAAANMDRADLARSLLLSRGGPSADGKPADSLLERLKNQYDLRAYEMAGATTETQAETWEKNPSAPPAAPAQPTTNTAPATRPAATRAATAPTSSIAIASSLPASSSAPAGIATGGMPVIPKAVVPEAPPGEQETNIAAALQKVLADTPSDRLAGVLLLSDGRHNALGEDVDAVAQRLGSMGVKVFSVPMGAAKPPLDGAIAAVDVPEVVFAKDRMAVTAELKLDGMAGRRVKIALYDDANREVDGNSLLVPSDSYRARVQLSDSPDKPGIHSYRLQLQHFDDEAFASNNEYAFSVSVTDDRVRLLYIEGRPRWEFRYVKNLFASRDKTVRLQYVLLDPDRIPGLPPPPPVVASASAEEAVEATQLPQSLAEWMKFDVVVLGDVSPQALRPDDLDAIRRFVTERGGTLIVVAGPLFMPSAYFGTPLADVLPVTWQGLAAIQQASPAGAATLPGLLAGAAPAGGGDVFHIALTPEGRQHVILRLAVDPAENERLWESMPEIESRFPGLRAKPGATALAYAMPTTRPAFLEPNAPSDPEQVRRFQNDNALLLEQPAGMGEVLMLTFDHTWRLRYGAGDLYHHKLWGQVLRWATANKLPSGTSFVKIGADRARYWPGQHVRIRARIVSQDLSPVKSAEVAVKLSRDGQFVSRRQMDYRPDSPGLYQADLGALEAGRYVAELDAPAASDILAAENATTVQTEFSVLASTPRELIELSPDRGLLNSLAERTGGAVIEAARIADAADRFGPGQLVRTQKSEYAIWDHWPLLALILVLATAEWILRKKVGLA
jgi:hypothetical protein